MADSAVLTIGPEKITNLRAAILSDHKIRLNWDPIDHKDKQIRWALLRNGVEIALLDDVHSFEDHVESDQVYIYRVIAFMQDKDPFYREFPGAKDADTFIKQEHSIFYSAPLIISTEKSDDFKQSSFIFRTYLLSKDVVDSDDVQKNSDEYYISIHEKERSRSIVQSSITPWEGSTPVEMLKGLIDVEVNGYFIGILRVF